jgi:hypothetical protein
MTAVLSDVASRAIRVALRTPARSLILTLEDRGVTLRLVAGVVRCRPAHLVTPEELAQLRAHRTEVRTLVRYRATWSSWPKPVPSFTPSCAFATPAEVCAFHDARRASLDTAPVLDSVNPEPDALNHEPEREPVTYHLEPET